MKNKLIVLISCVFMLVIYSSENKAEAQVVLSRKCCDASGTVRCILENWTPLHNDCFCYGQGTGYAC